MKIKKIAADVSASLALAALATIPAHAQQVTFTSDSTSKSAFTYTSGTGISVGSTSLFTAIYDPGGSDEIDVSKTHLSFTGLDDSGNLVAPAPGGDVYVQNLVPKATDPGTFTLTSTTSFTDGTTVYKPGTVVLQGTFSEATLSGAITTPASSTGSLRTEFNDVVYTGGVFFGKSGLANPGAFSFDLTSIKTGATSGLLLNSTGTKFRTFTAAGSGTYSATAAVPEPSSVAAFAATGLGVMGLMLRARKSRGSLAS
jgi:hypothetical protein